MSLELGLGGEDMIDIACESVTELMAEIAPGLE
jgi:hypothetical protein